MKDVRFFTEYEMKYIKENKVKREFFFNEEAGGFEEEYYAEDFLFREYFNLFSNGLQEPDAVALKNKFCLSDVEVLIMRCFLGPMSYYFRDDAYILYGGVPEIVKEMNIVLESLLQKAPKHTGEIVYRYLKTQDKTDFSVGDIYCPSHSVTTTIDGDWEIDTNIYVIKPLPQERTRAHDLYKIYNHGSEKQVNFLRNTKFIITEIDEKGINGHKRFFMDEIE